MNIYHLTNTTSDDVADDHLYEMVVVAPDFDTAMLLACGAAQREGTLAWQNADNIQIGVVTSPLDAFKRASVICRDSHRW